MAQFTWPAQSATVTIASVGTNGASAPTSSELIGVKDGSGNLQPVTQGQAVMASSLPVVIASNQSAVSVTGPLTDTQLRATSVPVSGPLTDTQLRATSVPVTGPLTDTQLRAAAVPVSGSFFQATQPVSAAALPLPAGAATETTLSALNTKVTACNTGAVTISAQLPTGSNVIGALTANQTVNNAQINGVAPLMGAGTTGTGSQRVTIATSPTSSVTSVAAAIATTSLLASNTARRGATFFNESTAVLYLKLGATASTTSYTVQVAASGYYEVPGPAVYTGAIDGIWAAASGSVRITELS